MTSVFLLMSALALAGNASAQVAATLTDFGLTAPTPGADDQSQLTIPAGANSPDGLNYYFDNGTPPGQTFTTGANPNGYVLSSLTIGTAGNGGSLPGAGQAYVLRLYSVSGSAATLLASYQSQNNFTFTETDWLQWTNLSFGLQPNTQYAYSFSRVSGGWENMANVGNNPYAGGEVVLIPKAGGAMTLGASHNFDASFNVGLNPAAALTVNPPVIAPQNAVTAGTAVTVSTAPAVGPGPITYQWQTDGGSGGALTNIPAATSATLSVNTTGMVVGSYQYAVVASNGSSSITSATNTLAIYTVGNCVLTDVGSVFNPGSYDISQLVGGSVTGGGLDGLNYYLDQNTPGQTFTTGTNAQGYLFQSLTFGTGHGGTQGGGIGNLQGYSVYLYSVNTNTSNATLMASYTNAGFSIIVGDYTTVSGFSPVTLLPGHAYAFTIHRATSGWCNMDGTSGTDLYVGGQACMIAANGGLVSYGNSGTADAAFDVVATPVGVSVAPIANPIDVSPTAVTTAGAPLTLTEAGTGSNLHFAWQTDGGNGGTLTNIPSATTSNLLVNTTGWNPGLYRYVVIVSNTYGAATSAVSAVTITLPATTANLMDIGAATPVPVSDDQYQTISAAGANSPDGINYYTDNGSPPGQTFSTGNNPNGYILSSLAIQTAGNGGQLPAAGQAYVLRIYTVSGASATLYQSITSTATNFTFVETDWLRWSGLNVALAPNKTYGYSFGKLSTGSGWENLGNVSGDPYAGGQVGLFPPNGGTITVGNSGSFDAVFVVGLVVTGNPIVTPAVFSPATTVYAGTPVKVSASVTGTGPFTYQWQAQDASNPGTFTNVPGANATFFTVDTTGLDVVPALAYRLVASNGAGSTTGESSALTVLPASTPMIHVGSDTTPISADRFIGGTATFTASFDGTLPIAYQWQVDTGTGATNIVGQTNTALILANLQVAKSGNYSLHAVNGLGFADSTPAVLTVYTQPVSPMTVNFQWRSYEGGNDVGVFAGSGVPGFGGGTYWNQINGPTTGITGPNFSSTSPSYAADGVTLSGINMTTATSGSWCWTSTPVIGLLDNAAQVTGTQNIAFYLPSGLYNIALFSCNGTEAATTTDSSTIFTINGISKTTVPTTDTSFIEGNNYVVFSNVVVAGGSLNAAWTQVAGRRFGNFNGAQVRYLGTVNTTPPTITRQVSGGQLTMSWPANAGWTLQVQTNSSSLGLGTNWVTVPGSSAVTQLSMPIDTADGSVFYRLILQ